MTGRERLQDFAGNGDKAKGTFSAGEMRRRLDAIRRHMADNNVDAALFTSYHNINYYADFMYCQFGRRYGFFVDQDNATSISAGIDGGQPWRQCPQLHPACRDPRTGRGTGPADRAAEADRPPRLSR